VFALQPLPAKAVKPLAARRSQRLLLSIRVVVSGKQPSGSPFAEDAFTQVVNAHGALVLMKQLVSIGDRLQIRNVKTTEEVGCTVVDVGERQEHMCTVGLEFDLPSPRFWRVAFPPDDWSARSPEAKKLTLRPRPVPKQPS
jgi:hypothetical protein